LTEYTIPYSTANLETISHISNYYCSFFQQLISFKHNNFEINLELETLQLSDFNQLQHLTTEEIETLFLQSVVLYRIIKTMDLDFIDFKKMQIKPGLSLKFAILLPPHIIPTGKKKSAQLNELLELFKQNPHFESLSESNFMHLFYSLAGKYSFDENLIYAYRYSDLAAGLLKNYPVTNLRSGANIKININTPGSTLMHMVKQDIVNHQAAETVFMLDIFCQDSSIIQAMNHLIPDTYDTIPIDTIDAIDRLTRYLQQSSFTSTLLMINGLTSRKDAQFLKYLMEVSEICNIVLVCFNAKDKLLHFDLELNEKPPNLAKEYLTYNADHPILEQVRTREDNSDATLGARIMYLLTTNQWQEAGDQLNSLLIQESGFDFELPQLDHFISQNPILFREESQLLEKLISAFVEGNNTAQAQDLFDAYRKESGTPLSSLSMLLKNARIFQKEKDYPRMVQLLEQVKSRKKIPEDLEDEFYFLSYIDCARLADKKGMDSNYKKLKKPIYRYRAALKMSDHYLFNGDHQRAQNLLSEAALYFKKHRFARDYIEIQNQQAKLFRINNKNLEAEALYKRIFVQSETHKYSLLSSYICVDLGNLYHVTERFSQADTWYRKALKLFNDLNNTSGINLAKSNLLDIEKINGNWEKTKVYLESILSFNAENSTVTSLAVDYYNIGHLEFLKHNFPQAVEFIETAASLFKKSNSITYLLDCELLKWQIQCMGGNYLFDQKKIKQYNDQITFSSDQKHTITLIAFVTPEPSLQQAESVAKTIDLIQSKTNRYQLISVLIHIYKFPALLDRLKSLSMDLSKETKNYYYYEYYYIYYNYFWNEDKDGFDPEHKARFNDIYYFFLRNRRTLSPAILKQKQILDQQEASYDIFKSARMVVDSKRWHIPIDFFNSFTAQLRQLESVDLVRLIIYERESSKTQVSTTENSSTGHSQPNQPLFDFSTSFSGGQCFPELTREIMLDAQARPDHLNLLRQDILQLYRSQEKAFYLFTNTKVILWRLSESLFGILLLAFSDPDSSHIDFLQRHNVFLQKFGSLIHHYYETEFKLNQRLGFIIGRSQAIKTLKEQILKISKVDFSLLIRGESGSGKELVAKAVHLLSRRCNNSFVPVNAAAIPENLLEAELFGYKKGAFTGANESKKGLIETANQGTLFLDEIADLPITLQAKLLRVLQEGEIRRLGETKTVSIDIRLICATNKNLKEMICQQQFREDLFFRIQDLTIDVPPLRARSVDIPMLTLHFMEKYGFTIPAENELKRICHYFQERSWTGNVRELESHVKRLITYYPEFDISPPEEDMPPLDTGLIAARELLEKKMLLSRLVDHNWNRKETAASLKISRQHLFQLINKYKIKK
jgi:predicted ATP-dependent protease